MIDDNIKKHKTDKQHRTTPRDRRDGPGTYPTPAPSLVVCLGQTDFRLAVISCFTRYEGYTEDFLYFVAISELFKDAQERERVAATTHGFRNESTIDNFPQPDDYARSSNTPGWVVPWQKWGSQWAHILEGTLRYSNMCHIYMNRVAFLMPYPPMDANVLDDDGEHWNHSQGQGRNWGSQYVYILDFNLNALHESYPARIGGAWSSVRRSEGPFGPGRNEKCSLADLIDDHEMGPTSGHPSRESCSHEQAHSVAAPVSKDVFTQSNPSQHPYHIAESTPLSRSTGNGWRWSTQSVSSWFL